MSPAEIVVWLGRLVTLAPELIALWKAVEDKNEGASMDAALALRRKVSDEQMREALK